MPTLLQGPTSSPTSDAGNSATLDSAPPMPRSQHRPPSILHTPPADEGMGANGMGSDPLIQTMQVTKQVDQAFQQLATIYPDAVSPLAQLQQAFRQLIMGLATAPTPGAGGMAPGMVPPLPQQSGPSAGTGMGIGL